MFIYSFKANKKTVIGVLLVVAALIILSFVIPGQVKQTEKSVNTSQKAQTNEERIAFIEKFGYDVNNEPIEIRDVLIPEQFDDTYTAYNELQRAQGFDLEKYKGKSAKSYSYAVKDYPGIEDSEKHIRVNLLVLEGQIIGADVCSVKLDGFMHALINGKTG